MGNMCGGEANDQDVNVGRNYKSDRRDPARKQKKKTAKRGKGAEMGAEPGAESKQFSEGVRNSEFAPDPELEQGFPEDRVEYGTTPCLEDVDDEYTKEDKARRLKKKQTNGVEEAFDGDADFAEPERVNAA